MALPKGLRVIRANLIGGTLILLPLITTVYVFVKLFQLVDSVLPSLFHALLPAMMPERWPTGVGVFITLAAAFLAGLLAKNYLGGLLIQAGNSVIARIPLLNKVYVGIQQILDAAVGANKKLFERPVLVEFPQHGSYAIGFVTATDTGEIGRRTQPDCVSVFIPTTPNPTSGFLIYVSAASLIDLGLNVETAMKLVMSAGIVNSDQIRKTQHLYTLPSSAKGWNWLNNLRRRRTGPAGDGQAPAA